MNGRTYINLILWPFNAKRRKQLKRLAASADSVLVGSELENELNR